MDQEICLVLGQVSPSLLNEVRYNLQKDIYGAGGRLTKRQATSRSDHLWPELWRGMSKNAKLREKHKWAIEKPKLDNARRLRGIYFIDPEDKEFKEIFFFKKSKKKIGNANGSSYALQDLKEKQAWGDP